MAARKVSIIEQSTRESSVESILNPGSASSTRGNARRGVVSRSPAPTSDRGYNSSTKLLIHSYPEYSAIGVPVPANGLTLDSEETVQENDSQNASSGSFLDWYKNAAVHFRNSSYIHILQFVFSYIPVSAIIMGLTFNRECPEISYLPLLVTIMGIIGVVFIGFWIAHSYSEHSGTTCSDFLRCLIQLSLVLLLVGIAIEIYLIGRTFPSFEPSTPDYCSKTLYFYTIYKEVVSAAALILAVLLYFPKSSLHTCCQNCSAPSPAGAFFPTP